MFLRMVSNAVSPIHSVTCEEVWTSTLIFPTGRLGWPYYCKGSGVRRKIMGAFSLLWAARQSN